MSSLFKNAIPYALDIRRLTEYFPPEKLVEGLVITHEELEVILYVKRATGRYYGVINSWLAKQRSAHGINSKWVPTLGVEILDPARTLDHAETRTKQKVRQLGRAIRIFSFVDRTRLDPIGQQRLDHQRMVTARLAQTASAVRTEMAIDLAPVKVMPKRPLLEG